MCSNTVSRPISGMASECGTVMVVGTCDTDLSGYEQPPLKPPATQTKIGPTSVSFTAMLNSEV